MESSYLKESQKRDTSSPSPQGASYYKETCDDMSELGMTEETIKVTLNCIQVNKKDWQRLNVVLEHYQVQLFISNVLDDMISEILYRNPEMLQDYLNLKEADVV